MELSSRQIREMKCIDYIAYVHDILDKELDACSGIKQDIGEFNNEIYYHNVMDIRWKGNIHFEVCTNKGNGWYYVTRNGQEISLTYHFGKVTERVINNMQMLINDVERGRYNSKKTLTEQALQLVDERGLTSYMNHTKWKELFGDIYANMKNILISYKTLFDEKEPTDEWIFNSDESIRHIKTVAIEWFKINPKCVEFCVQERSSKVDTRTYSVEDELVEILKKYNIPYEYLKDEKVYMIYGYK